MDLNEIEVASGIIRHQIGDDVYTIKLMPSIKAWAIAEDIGEMILPVLGTIFDGEEGMGEDTWLNVGLLISKSIKELKLQARAKEFLIGATKNGIPINVDADFLGAKGLKVLSELVELALKVNVLDFLFEWLEEKGLKIPSLNSLMTSQEKTINASSN